MTHFTFNGDWEYAIQLPAFEKFKRASGAYFSNQSSGTAPLKLVIEDDVSDDPDPTLEQLKTIEFIFEHQQKIADAIVERALQELPTIIADYELQEEDEFQEVNENSVKQLIRIGVIEVKRPTRDGLAYFDVMGGCEWDEEHGLNILMHATRILTFGGIDGNSYWDALKDNGTFEAVKNAETIRQMPVRYTPHPKYGKLKPAQKSANETYELDLIMGGFNAKFIEEVNNGQIDINGKWQSQNKSYLEAACWYKNNELVKFLLDQKADIRYALHQCIRYNSNPEALELILTHGADINAQDLFGNTVLYILADQLAKLYNHKQQSIQHGWNREEKLDEEIRLQQQKIRNLIDRGADPHLKDRRQNSVFDLGRNLNEMNKQAYIDFFDSCVNEK